MKTMVHHFTPRLCPSIYFYVFMCQYVLMLMVQPQLLLTFDLPVILDYVMIYYRVQIVGLSIMTVITD